MFVIDGPVRINIFKRGFSQPGKIRLPGVKIYHFIPGHSIISQREEDDSAKTESHN
jgi:hypothetical protein